MFPDWLSRHRGLTRLAAIIVPVLLGLLVASLRPLTGAVDALLFVLVIAVCAATGDRVTGFLAALASAFSFDFFCTSPYYSLKIAAAEDVEVTIIMMLVGLAINELALWGFQHRAASARREGYLGLSLDASAPAGSPDEASTRIAGQLARVLGVDKVAWAPEAPDQALPTAHPDGRVTLAGADMQVSRTGLSTQQDTVIPVHRGGEVIGHFAFMPLSSASWPSPEQIKVAVLLAEQMGSA